MLKDLIVTNRSYRRFDQSVPIDRQALVELVELARCSASGGNAQPLKYALTCDAQTNARIFPQLRWAGALPDWAGPAESERPTAYIIILHDTSISPKPGVDHGIAAQSILLGAVEKGLGGCMIGSIERTELRDVLDLPRQCDILLVLALGKPAETVVIEDAQPGGSIDYYRSGDEVHHVPKRTLKELIVN